MVHSEELSSKEFTYEQFMEISNSVDRNEKKLPEESVEIIKNVKYKLKIKDFNDNTHETMFEPVIVKKKKEIRND